MFSDMRLRRFLIFLLAITVFIVFGSADTAQAGSGVYPDSPILIAPLDYGGGNTSVEFKFPSYIYNDGTFVGYPIAYHIEMYSGSTRIVNDDLWSPATAYSPFSFGGTYSWRV